MTGRRLRRWLTVAASILSLPFGTAATAGGMDTHRVAVERYGNDAPWHEPRIPFFESADPMLDEVHYYRLKLLA